MDLYAIDLKFETNSAGAFSAEPPTLIGSFPTTTATNFQYSTKISTLVFSDYVCMFIYLYRALSKNTQVYADGNLSSVKEQDEAWEARGNTAMVFDVCSSDDSFSFPRAEGTANRKHTSATGTHGLATPQRSDTKINPSTGKDRRPPRYLVSNCSAERTKSGLWAQSLKTSSKALAT